MVIAANKERSKVPDYQIINSIRGTMSPDFQRLIPKATQASIQDSVNALLTNTPARNQFTGVLMNRFGSVIGRNRSWENPLSKYKIGMLEYGDTIEEIMVGLLQARSYDVNEDYGEKELFSQERPYVQASFHKINRQDQYKFTLNRNDLQRAFTPGDSFGLTSFVEQVMSSAMNSDQRDEYTAMMSMFRMNYDNGGFFTVKVPDVGRTGSTANDAKVLLRAVREYAHRLTFLSSNYNAAKMETAAKRDDLQLFLTSSVDAAVDVEALAQTFHIDKADFHTRKDVMPPEHFNIPGFQAALTTSDFFVVADSHYENVDMMNPAGRYTNYWLQHDQIISLSRFAPTILFTADDETTVITINESTPTEISAPKVYELDEDGNLTAVDKVVRGQNYVLESDVTLDNPEGINDAVRYGVQAPHSYDTRVDAHGGLYVGAQEKQDKITLFARAVGAADVSATSIPVVSGDRLQLWPNPGIVKDETVAGRSAEGGEDTE